MLHTARLDAGLSRDALAHAIGASAHTVGCLERERRPPSEEVAERLCTALSLDAWRSAVLLASAVDTAQLRTRRGVRHVNRRGTPPPLAVRERITAERAAGRSWAAIARGLNTDGVPTAERGQWWASSVSRAAVAQPPLSVPPPTLARQDQRKVPDAQR
ncbi:helix-turn-helix domain-containing protein [Streptomyces sp. 7R007]